MDFVVGMKGVFRHVVREEDTAHAAGNPGVHVLATPQLILFCEMAAFNAIKDALDDRTASVGIHNDIHHLAATAVGEEVEITATLAEIDRRRHVFEITGRDPRNRIVRGIHERFLVDREKFLASLPKAKG